MTRFEEFSRRLEDHQVVELYVAISAIEAITKARCLGNDDLAYILGVDTRTDRQVMEDWAAGVDGCLSLDYMEGGLACPNMVPRAMRIDSLRQNASPGTTIRAGHQPTSGRDVTDLPGLWDESDVAAKKEGASE